MKLNLVEVAKMCGGELSLNCNENLLIENVVIDSRNVNNNNLFVAIIGEKHDGHSFVLEILQKFSRFLSAVR